MNRLPDALRAALEAEIENLNRYNRLSSEIISITLMEIKPSEGRAPHQIIYKVILFQMNCFVVLEQASFDGSDLGVSKTMLTIGSAKDIIERAPAWTEVILHITVSRKVPEEMVAQYGFAGDQKEYLEELLKPEYISLWNALLYGISGTGDGSMIEIAATQIGNVGGEPYWSWYGLGSRVEWCSVCLLRKLGGRAMRLY